MKPSGRAIRIYGTNDRYGEHGWSPSDQPFTVADFPRAGATVSVTFGKVPDVVQHELSDRIAIANAMLDALTGQAPVGGLHDLLASRELLSFDEYAFYVTLAMDRDVNLEYAPADPSGVWINPFELEEADREIRDDAAQAFDTVVARLAPVLGSRFFSERRDERDVVIFRSPGQPSLFFPSLSMRARASVARDAASSRATRFSNESASFPA